jgi:hypothetical protein
VALSSPANTVEISASWFMHRPHRGAALMETKILAAKDFILDSDRPQAVWEKSAALRGSFLRSADEDMETVGLRRREACGGAGLTSWGS